MHWFNSFCKLWIVNANPKKPKPDSCVKVQHTGFPVDFCYKMITIIMLITIKYFCLTLYDLKLLVVNKLIYHRTHIA